MRSQPAARSCSAARAPSSASEMKPTSTTSQSSACIRSETRAAERCSCGSRSGNCGQYAPSPPDTSPTFVRRTGTCGRSAPVLDRGRSGCGHGRPPCIETRCSWSSRLKISSSSTNPSSGAWPSRLEEVLAHLGLPPPVHVGGGHRRLGRGQVVGLDVADQQPVRAGEDRVAVPAAGRERAQHLRPHRRVPLAILGEQLGAHLQLEAVARHRASLIGPRSSGKGAGERPGRQGLPAGRAATSRSEIELVHVRLVEDRRRPEHDRRAGRAGRRRARCTARACRR